MHEKGLEDSLIVMIVRHSLDWYRSAWLYWKETGRFPRLEEEPQVEADSFEQFVRNCIASRLSLNFIRTVYKNRAWRNISYRQTGGPRQ